MIPLRTRSAEIVNESTSNTDTSRVTTSPTTPATTPPGPETRLSPLAASPPVALNRLCTISGMIIRSCLTIR